MKYLIVDAALYFLLCRGAKFAGLEMYKVWTHHKILRFFIFPIFLIMLCAIEILSMCICFRTNWPPDQSALLWFSLFLASNMYVMNSDIYSTGYEIGIGLTITLSQALGIICLMHLGKYLMQ